MKKILLPFLILFCLQFAPAKAQWVTIPDANFVTKLTQLYPSCMNGNQMDTTCAQIVNATNIYIGVSGITNLSGIEYFDNLFSLRINNNPLTNLPSLPNSLQHLNCSNNNLTSINSLPYSLQTLNCNNNQLISLPNLPNSLKTLKCRTNSLMSLPALTAQLDTIDCFDNNINFIPSLPLSLTHLDCSWNHNISIIPSLPNNLVNLLCYNNDITILPSLPVTLKTLNCAINQLTTLPVLPNSLENLDYSDNSITTHPILPNNLQVLACSGNQLTSLPNIPNGLQTLTCGSNQFSTINNLPNTIKVLSCQGGGLNSISSLPDSLENLYLGVNQLTNLPALPLGLKTLWCNNNLLTHLPIIPVSLTELNASFNQLTSIPQVPSIMNMFNIENNNVICLSNLPDGLFGFINASISNNPITCVPNQTNYAFAYPLCLDFDTANNPNNCVGLVNISGHIFTDQNNNCTYNASDLGTSNIAVKLYDSLNILVAQNYSVNGAYGFSTNQLGSYNVLIEDALLPVAMDCGAINNQNVVLNISNPTISNINFSVVCDTVNDISVKSISRQGFVFPNQIHTMNTKIFTHESWYHLDCDTTTFSGSVILNVIGPVSYFSPSPNALIPILSGNTFTYNIADFNSLTPNSFGLQFLTDTTAQAGDQICVHVEINPTPMDADTTNNVYDFCYQVVNSYDPNMKEVYPVNVLPGYDDWFTYTIHFQNTGNAPAFNIRLRDTLDANLDINSFEVRGYSHPAQISINGNILTVRFNNIMLPDSTTDYEGSMGYFQYRLKPLPNMPNGTQIENTAYIYFDFNAPIVTNTTLNNFDMTVKTTKMLVEEQNYVLYPNPSTGIFMFKESKGIQTVEVFNMMGELVLNQGNTKLINLQGFPKGIYVARVNGTQVCRLVKE